MKKTKCKDCDWTGNEDDLKPKWTPNVNGKTTHNEDLVCPECSSNNLEDVMPFTQIVASQFCPKCSPSTWGNHRVEHLPDVQECVDCGYKHHFNFA